MYDGAEEFAEPLVTLFMLSPTRQGLPLVPRRTEAHPVEPRLDQFVM
jgi:hypothetical protein